VGTARLTQFPQAVANLLSSSGVTDIRVLQAAVLHDTVEDTHTTVGESNQQKLMCEY
jgi:(p)ppGpp synthase/HD superfamily hydrolase